MIKCVELWNLVFILLPGDLVSNAVLYLDILLYCIISLFSCLVPRIDENNNILGTFQMDLSIKFNYQTPITERLE
jgi:hypothetical protein